MVRLCKRCNEERPDSEVRKGTMICKECYRLRPKRVHSEKARKMSSEKLKGRKKPEHSAKLKGQKRSPEQIEAQRQKLIGRKYSIEHRLAISAGQIKAIEEGRHHWKVNDNTHPHQERCQLRYKIWKEEVKKIKGNKCKMCESTERLHVHHIESYKDFPEKRLDPHNGEILCIRCHMRHHRLATKNL